MRDKMMLYGVTLAKRYTKRQKAYFLAHILESYSAYGFPAKLQSRKSWTGNINNVIAGNLETAGKIVAAAYDTPARAFLPGYRYYPFHTEKIKRKNGKIFWCRFDCLRYFQLPHVLAQCGFFKTHAMRNASAGFPVGRGSRLGHPGKKEPCQF